MSNYSALLNDLKLFGVKESIDYRSEEAIKSNLDFKEFLSLILNDEALYRKNKRYERLKRMARFKDIVHLEEFDARLERGVTRSMIKKFASLNFLTNFENLVFNGGTGAGKSYLAQAIGQKCCSAGFETSFISMNKFFKEVEAAEATGTYLRLLSKLKRAKVLIFDDFGLRNYTHKEATVLYDVLEDRYQKGVVIVTSQVKPPGWINLFEDEVIAEAITDRIASCAHVIEVEGPSYREHHAPKEKIAGKK